MQYEWNWFVHRRKKIEIAFWLKKIVTTSQKTSKNALVNAVERCKNAKKKSFYMSEKSAVHANFEQPSTWQIKCTSHHAQKHHIYVVYSYSPAYICSNQLALYVSLWFWRLTETFSFTPSKKPAALVCRVQRQRRQSTDRLQASILERLMWHIHRTMSGIVVISTLKLPSSERETCSNEWENWGESSCRDNLRMA